MKSFPTIGHSAKVGFEFPFVFWHGGSIKGLVGLFKGLGGAGWDEHWQSSFQISWERGRWERNTEVSIRVSHPSGCFFFAAFLDLLRLFSSCGNLSFNMS